MEFSNFYFAKVTHCFGFSLEWGLESIGLDWVGFSVGVGVAIAVCGVNWEKG